MAQINVSLHGTCHFASFESARRYYAAYGYSTRDVERKLADGEIKLGAPQLDAFQSLHLNHKEGRYYIETKGAKSENDTHTDC